MIKSKSFLCKIKKLFGMVLYLLVVSNCLANETFKASGITDNSGIIHFKLQKDTHGNVDI